MSRRPMLAARAEALLARHWWRPRPSWLARLLSPLAWLYGRAVARRRSQAPQPQRAPVPLLVVGNFIAGGAGKTPTVMAVVQALRAAGRRPGVISRGHGRSATAACAVQTGSDPAGVGDEPLLIHRRTGVPVWVARDRIAAARGLCAAHPDVDVLVADDGLQHHALARDAELVVFDERGIGNGLLLPAGPLREPLPATVPSRMRVLYTGGGHATAPLAGAMAKRTVAIAVPLQAWCRGNGGGGGDSAPLALQALRGRPLLAAAGLAAPQNFFAMLQAHGLTIRCLPLPDHHTYATLPWPADTPDVITTEKDAVKLRPERLGTTRIWVVPLDLQLPAALVGDLMALLFAPRSLVATAPAHDP